MKIRNGFVSNSSSSSFICEVCGEVGSGMDCGPEDFDMTELPCGHLMCKNHITDLPEEEFRKSALEEVQKEISKKSYRKESLKKLYEKMLNSKNFEKFVELYREMFDTEYTTAQCPICTFEVIRDKDMLNYLIKNNSLTTEEIIGKVKESLINGDLELL